MAAIVCNARAAWVKNKSRTICGRAAKIGRDTSGNREVHPGNTAPAAAASSPARRPDDSGQVRMDEWRLQRRFAVIPQSEDRSRQRAVASHAVRAATTALVAVRYIGLSRSDAGADFRPAVRGMTTTSLFG